MNIFNKSNLSWLYVYQGSNYLLPLLIFPLLQARLGIETFSQLIVCLSIATILISIVDGGFSTRGLKLCASGEQSKVSLYSFGLTIKLLILIVVFPILIFVIGYVSEVFLNYEYLFWILGLLLWRVVSIDYLWHAEQDYRKLGLLHLCFRLSSFLVVFFLTTTRERLFYFSLHPIIFSLLFLGYQRFFEGLVFQRNSIVVKPLEGKAYLLAASSNAISAVSLNVPILAYSVLFSESLAFVGIFVYFDKATKAFRQLLKPILLRMIPRYSGLISDRRDLMIFLRQISYKLIAVYLSTVFVGLSILKFLPSKFTEEIPLIFLYIFFLVVPLGLLNYGLIYVFGLNNDRERAVFSSSIISLILLGCGFVSLSIIELGKSLYMPVLAVMSEVFLCLSLFYAFLLKNDSKAV